MISPSSNNQNKSSAIDPSLKKHQLKKYRSPASGFMWPGPRLERALNKATIRSPFLRWLLSFVFLPLAWRFGMRINYSLENFFVEVPHKKLVRNTYGTVGGAALLANLELAAGSYLFMRTDGGHRMVCRNVTYRFMLPSSNGLHFKVEPMNEEDLEASIQSGKPFNTSLKVKVFSRGKQSGKPERCIGRGEVRFHLWAIQEPYE
ncbi:hypothetical protein IMCC1989_2248 [gamma proteobacterium IMCC1989]|nr:hypothetical protein IMCC1989_2248 [gamma proteobacterium IMCC1989]